MTRRSFCATVITLVAVFTISVRAADVTGQWTTTFQTQIGEQSYTFDFVVKGTTLTGKMKGNMTGESMIQDGKVDGDKITFTEAVTFQDMPLRITYAGQVTSNDEIKFTRTIADVGNEDFVAKRVK
jgi:hypothetical protein